MREFLGICLRRAGHEVTVAQTGGEALDHLRAQPVDIVVSDLRMPGVLDGLGLLQAIKSAGALQAGAFRRSQFGRVRPGAVEEATWRSAAPVERGLGA